MGQQRVPVWVKALDPLSQVGLVYALRQRPEILLVTENHHLKARTTLPLVALIAVDSLDPTAGQVLRAAAHRGYRRTVVIAGVIDDDAVTTAVELGVSGMLRRADATAGRIVQLIQAAAAGDGRLPAPHSRSQAGLSDRETHVLRLVADGKDTHEIARELSYSERTVKNVLHDVTTRLKLRNRSHAVAYALREGLI
ncbi:response regulator transcription factor [Kribbella sp. NPDC023855]|uniref:helix-turn-helix transcriptional regulator n=1 Tax=Kribbella sp. NPDC023855 TaxID=3154698 RepID=UPI0033DCCD96